MKYFCLALLTTVFCAWAAPALGQDTSHPAPVELTREDDHLRTMTLLNITALRQGANGRDTTAANYANYDEARANPYPHLPDPLLTNDRQKVTTAEMWWTVRRPEIVEFFDREIYGRVPDVTPAVTWEVVSATDSTIGGISVLTKKLVGHVDNTVYPPHHRRH